MTEEKIDKKTLEGLLSEDNTFNRILGENKQDPFNPDSRYWFAKKSGLGENTYSGVAPDVFRRELQDAYSRVHKSLVDYVGENVDEMVDKISEDTIFDMATQLDNKFEPLYLLMQNPDYDKIKQVLGSTGNYSSYFLAGVSNEKLDYCFKVFVETELAKKKKSLGEISVVEDKEVFTLDKDKVKGYLAEQVGKIKEESRDRVYSAIAIHYLNELSNKERAKAPN